MNNVNDKNDNINDHSLSYTLQNAKLLHIRSTQSARAIKGNPFFIFNLKTSSLSNCLRFNGTKSQIFRSRKDSVSVQW